MYRNFSIAVVLLFLAIVGGSIVYQRQALEEVSRAYADSSARCGVQMEKLVTTSGERLVTFANEYSLGDSVVNSLSSMSWRPEHLVSAMPLFDVTSVWLFDNDLRAVCGMNADGNPAHDQNVDAGLVNTLRDAVRGGVFGHLFLTDSSGRLWECAYAPIQPSSDSARVTAPKGFLVAMRLWDEALCARYGDLLSGEVSLISPERHVTERQYKWTDAKFRAEHVFMSRSGENLAYLSLRRDIPVLDGAIGFFSHAAALAVGVAAVLLAAALLCGWLFFGRPVRRLVKARRIGDMSLLEKARTTESAYGMLADSVAVAYEVKNSKSSNSLSRSGDGDKLVAREKFLSTILHNLNGCVMVLSPDGVLTLAEGRDMDSYGMQKDRDVGRSIANILRGQERLQQFEDALRGKRSSMEQKVGDNIFLTMCEPLKKADGSLDYVVVLALDVTEKRQVEETLLRAKQEAERADRIKTQFLAVMSHETRTPLNGVLGFASVLRETPLNEEQMSYLDRIVESGQNLLRLLTDILDLARLEAGEGKHETEPVSLQALVYQFAERYRLACQQKPKGHLEFELDVDQRLPDYIESDNDMLSRILSSILDNAVKFTDKGRVKLTVSWVARDKEGVSGVRFTVTDTGPGISPEVARNLFNPFQQGDSSNTRKHGGLGLGLTIANKLALQLGGRLSFETKEDVGTTFFFFLPTRAIEENALRSFQPREKA